MESSRPSSTRTQYQSTTFLHFWTFLIMFMSFTYRMGKGTCQSLFSNETFKPQLMSLDAAYKYLYFNYQYLVIRMSIPSFQELGAGEQLSRILNFIIQGKISPIPSIQRRRTLDLSVKPKKSIFVTNGRDYFDKWILYIPGGNEICNSTLLVPKLQEAFPNHGIVIVAYNHHVKDENQTPLMASLEIYKFLIQVLKMKSSNISLISDGIGSNICLGMLGRLRHCGLSPPNCAVFISPWIDLNCCGPSFRNSTHKYHLEPSEHLSNFELCSCKQDSIIKDEFKIKYDDLRDLPPIHINSGGSEPLLDDTNRLYTLLKSNSNTINHSVYQNMPHTFQLFFFEESNAAISEIQTFILKHIENTDNSKATRIYE